MARVLIVEDDESIARMLEIELQLAGHEVTIANDGRSGLAAIGSASPEVVLLDWMMPDITGIQVLDQLKAKGVRSSMRVVMMTAKVQERDIIRGWQAGVDAYISKPFEMDEVTASIEEVLAASPADLEKRRRTELSKAGMLRALDDMLGE